MQDLTGHSRRFQKKWKFFGLMLVMSCFFLATGCATGGKPQYNIEKYLLSYPAPSWNQTEKLPVSIKFNRFSIATAYNSTHMIFRNDGYSFDAFNYSRWAVNPADMVADSILSDMRGSKHFLAVFSRHQTDEGRFIISGGIEEFYLRIDKNGKTALISMSISMEDSREKESGKKIMFQRNYHREEPLQAQSPRGYCQAASQAMQSMSREIISDVYAAAKNRLK